MAEFIAKHLISRTHIRDVEVKSCGLNGLHNGQAMHLGTQKALTQNAIPFSKFQSQQVSQSLFAWATDVLVMDHANYEALVAQFGRHNKISKLTDYGHLGYAEVPDPWYTGDFDETYTILFDAIHRFFVKKALILL